MIHVATYKRSDKVNYSVDNDYNFGRKVIKFIIIIIIMISFSLATQLLFLLIIL
jgi:hypothetical protein